MNKSNILTLILVILFTGCASTQRSVSPQQQAFNNGTLLYSQEKYKEAAAEFKTALQLNANNYNAKAWLAFSYCRSGQNGEGIDIFNKLIYNNPTHYNNFNGLAYCYNENQQYDESISASKRALELKPNYSNAYFNMGVSYEKKHEYSKAIEMYQKAISITPNYSDASLSLAKLFLHNKNIDEAINVLQRASKFNPKNVKILELLANIYYGSSNFAKAKETISKAIEFQTHIGVGIRIKSINGFTVVDSLIPSDSSSNKEIIKGDIILEIDGNDIEGMHLKVVANKLSGPEGTSVKLTIQRKDKEFEKVISRAKFVEAKAASKLELRSLIERKLGSKDAALRDAQKANELDDSFGLISLAAINIDDKNYEQASSLLLKANNNIQASIFEAIMYAKNGNMQKAKEKYLNLTQDYALFENIALTTDIAELLSHLKPVIDELEQSAKNYNEQGKYNQSIEVYTQMLSFAQNKAEVEKINENMINTIHKMNELPAIGDKANKHIVRAEMFIKSGNYPIAIEEFNKALKLAPFSALLYFNIAILEGKIANYPLAIDSMNMYIKMAPQAPNVTSAKNQVTKWEVIMEQNKEQRISQEKKIDAKPLDTDEDIRKKSLRRIRKIPSK
ncbi:protein containing Tetrtricopeptide repeat (TPR) domain [Sulfurimonas gotlandica GD1]|uniref:Protein containing Tetrtricopeptide repeat (TPR) domain n=2 Tax=Sulfurimonas TaxID=202746 RepID=B6BGJ2_SULGG|nr:tetratricopeptide repeat domain protein [Sulfurimonas gotlandica GD1]EHP29620.1 protein containing Tetrtricopeptide repeat (TPR) domain [Sulfurimonas gotlandica GD1]